jgi:PKD repeat protein
MKILLVLLLLAFPSGEVFCAVKGGVYIDGKPAGKGEAIVQLIFENPYEVFQNVTFAWDNGYNYNINTVSGEKWRNAGDTGTFRVLVGYNYLTPDNKTFTVSEGIHHVDLHVNRNDTSPPYKPSDPSPPHASTNVKTRVVLSVRVSDPDGDIMDVHFYDASHNLIGVHMGVPSGSIAKVVWQGLEMGTTYSWYAIADDSVKQTSSPTWSFSTSSLESNLESNLPPVAHAGGPYRGFPGEEIAFDGSKSYDPDGNITSWLWDFGDGNQSRGERATHAYKNPGTYSITLTVTDDNGYTDEDKTTALILSPNTPPSNPFIEGPTEGSKNVNYTYSAVSTDVDNDTIRYTFDWGDGSKDSSIFLPSGVNFLVNHSWSSPGVYTVVVSANDSKTTSQSNITVLIDAIRVREIGYLMDEDGDGIYDTFLYNDKESDTNYEGGKYLIDIDGDKEWDKIFDPETYELTTYVIKQTRISTTVLGVLALLLLVSFLIVIGREKKTK